MKKIILISCSSKKQNVKTTARNLYSSTLFKLSLEYAEVLNPDKIYILSAEHHLVSLDTILEPYDTTLSKVSSAQLLKKPNLKVLNKIDKINWGIKVLDQLSEVANFDTDEIMVLAGNDYYEPLSSKIDRKSMLLKGRIGERLQFLKMKIANLK